MICAKFAPIRLFLNELFLRPCEEIVQLPPAAAFSFIGLLGGISQCWQQS